MSENKKVSFGLGKGVLTLICILVWYGEKKDGGWATSPLQLTALGARWVLRQLLFSALAFKSQLLGLIIIEEAYSGQ